MIRFFLMQRSLSIIHLIQSRRDLIWVAHDVMQILKAPQGRHILRDNDRINQDAAHIVVQNISSLAGLCVGNDFFFYPYVVPTGQDVSVIENLVITKNDFIHLIQSCRDLIWVAHDVMQILKAPQGRHIFGDNDRLKQFTVNHNEQNISSLTNKKRALSRALFTNMFLLKNHEFIETKNSSFDFVPRILSSRNSIASIGFISAR